MCYNRLNEKRSVRYDYDDVYDVYDVQKCY